MYHRYQKGRIQVCYKGIKVRQTIKPLFFSTLNSIAVAPRELFADCHQPSRYLLRSRLLANVLHSLHPRSLRGPKMSSALVPASEWATTLPTARSYVMQSPITYLHLSCQFCVLDQLIGSHLLIQFPELNICATECTSTNFCPCLSNSHH